MRILRAYLKIPPCMGGMENHIYELSMKQRKLNHEVILAFNDGQATSKNDLQILRKIKLYPRLRTIYAILTFYIVLVFRLLYKSVKVDVIHIHGDWHSFMFASILKKITKCRKVIFSMHGDISEYSDSTLKRLIKQLSKADIVFATGYESYLSIKPYCNAFFQPSGVNDYFYLQQKTNTNDTFTIITVSRLAPKKNNITILEVAKKLPHFLFKILGNGEEFEELKRIITRDNLTNVRLLGMINKEQLPFYLQRADLFIFTSLWEGTPTAVLEALASGLPVVTSNAGGVSRIVKNNINGYIVENPIDVDAYIEKIIKLQEDKVLRQQMSENNKILADQFHWKKVAQNISDIMING